jgi:hypothetical protein
MPKSDQPLQTGQKDCLYSSSQELFSGEVYYQYPSSKITEFQSTIDEIQKSGLTDFQLIQVGYHFTIEGDFKIKATKESDGVMKVAFYSDPQDGLYTCELSNISTSWSGGSRGNFIEPVLNAVIGSHEYEYDASSKHPEARSPLDHYQAEYSSRCIYSVDYGMITPEEIYVAKKVSQDVTQSILDSIDEMPHVWKKTEKETSVDIPKSPSGWSSFSNYQYSSVLYMNDGEYGECTEKSVKKWATLVGPTYGFGESDAISYKSWACRMNISEVHTLGYMHKDTIYLYRKYIKSES